MENEQKFGFVTLIGETNSGKSTLVNTIIGAKISIVSHKVQTTRRKILGVYTDNVNQIVFIDTPGIFKPSRKLDSLMVSTAYGSLSMADTAMLILDVQKGITAETHNIIKRLSQSSKEVILVLNKIDLINKPDLLKLADELTKNPIFTKVFMISALKNKGIDSLLSYLLSKLTPNKWMFNEEDISDSTLSFTATEITREKIYKYLHQELPYMMVVVPELWEENQKAVTIKQVIFVTSNAHKKIAVGKGGSNIKRIGIDARNELEGILNKKVNLFLFVKVKERLFEDMTPAELMSII